MLPEAESSFDGGWSAEWVPRPTPATREEATQTWYHMHSRTQSQCLALSDAEGLLRGELLPFVLHIQTAQHVQVPGSAMFAAGPSEHVSMSQQLSLTWFHAPSRRFLGRTYLSEPAPVGFVLSDDSATAYKEPAVRRAGAVQDRPV